MMTVKINGRFRLVEDGIKLKDLVKSLGYRRASVFINNKHVLIGGFATRVLHENDEIKIVRILGGG